MNATSTMYNHIQATMRCAVIFVILLATFARVTIIGGEVKRNIYGGGNKVAVSGTTNVIIGQGK